MSTSISSREQKFNELYQDAERRRNKQDEYYQWQEEQYTFKPNIGVNSIRAHPDNGDQKSFFERLHQSGLAKEEHLKERRHRAKTRDLKTGQKLFHPKGTAGGGVVVVWWWWCGGGGVVVWWCG
jgi:hypothetical protein